jgi:hypothetical protein
MAWSDKPETPEEQERRLGLERAAQAIAVDLGTQLPKDVGFAVMLFDFGANGSFCLLFKRAPRGYDHNVARPIGSSETR